MDPTQRCIRAAPRAALAAVLSAALLALRINAAAADISIPPVTVGVGVQTNFYSCTNACIYSPGSVPAGDTSGSGFGGDSVRPNVRGGITDKSELTLNN